MRRLVCQFFFTDSPAYDHTPLDVKTARDMWEKLSTIYDSKSKVGIHLPHPTKVLQFRI